MDIKEFLNNIDINSINAETYQDNKYLEEVINKSNNELDNEAKQTSIKYAQLAVYLSNHLPYGIVKGI